MSRRLTAALLGTSLAAAGFPAAAEDLWSLHGQFTAVEQWHPAFSSPYQGTNSLTPGFDREETTDATLFAGVRLWSGAALYVNPEIDQGFGLSDTLGVAGFPSGEAYKVGQSKPYVRLQRAFLRQRFDLGGVRQPIEAGVNEVGGQQTADNLTLTVGKFSVVDLFDANDYAHDPRGDFLNWAVIDTAAFDYAADAWGYTGGMAVEWMHAAWTLRAGVFDLSDVPNSAHLSAGLSQHQIVAELEWRYAIGGHPGAARVLAFDSHARMGRYDDAVRLAEVTGAPADTARVRQFASRGGLALNLQQELTSDVGVFARVGWNDGSKEAYDFTDVNRSLAAGAVVKGTSWRRADDRVGIALAENEISAAARAYFAAGGLGILVGDGKLPHAAAESIVEAYYALALGSHVTLSADYQYLTNPAYNHDRGPVSVYGVRAHVAF